MSARLLARLRDPEAARDSYYACPLSTAVDRCRLSTCCRLSTVNPCRPVDPVDRGPLSTPVDPGLADNIYPLFLQLSPATPRVCPSMKGVPSKLQPQLKEVTKGEHEEEPSTSTQPAIISTCIAVMMAGCVLVPGSSHSRHPPTVGAAAHKHTAPAIILAGREHKAATVRNKRHM